MQKGLSLQLSAMKYKKSEMVFLSKETERPSYTKHYIKEVIVMNYDIEKVRQLQKKMDEILSELTTLCGEVPSVSRNLEMIKADVAVLKHSTMID